MQKKKFKVGCQYFDTFINGNGYYVDKTMLIKELVYEENTVNLITRPRRFGKSLMLNMLKSFFSCTADHSIFDGLAISHDSDICDRYMGKYPVFLLSLAGFNCNDFTSALRLLAQRVSHAVMEYRPECDKGQMHPDDEKLLRRYMSFADYENIPEKLDDLMSCVVDAPYQISRILSTYFKKNVIILIDEYDVPINKAYTYHFYDNMISVIKNMFELLLKNNPYIEISVITGCLRISKESIFTGMNNLHVWSGDEDFSYDYFGFTEKEVKDLLAYYSVDDVLDIARNWYDGYYFGNEHVYCPWDIMEYAKKCAAGKSKEPSNYWANSSENEVLERLLLRSDVKMQEDYLKLLAGETLRKTISTDLSYRKLNSSSNNIWSLLVSTGYLTAEKLENKSNYNRDEYDIRVPNGELRDLFGSLLHDWLKTTFNTNEEVIKDFCSAFPTEDPVTAEKCLKQILYDVTSSRDDAARKQQKEFFYHGMVLGLLYLKWKVRSNIQSGDGFCDLGFFCTDTLAIVIELKYDNSDVAASAQEALNQIEKKHYVDEFFRDGATKVLRYGIGCYRTDCRVLFDSKTSF